MSAARVLVYDHTSAVVDQVRRALRRLDPSHEVVECGRPRVLAELLTEQRFDVLVAGPGLDTRAGWERLRIIREELPEMVLVLALGRDADVDVHEVVRAGAVDVLDVPLGADAGDALGRALDIARRTRVADVPSPAQDAGDAGAADGAEDGDTTDVEAAVDADAVVAVEPSSPRRVVTVASASGGCGKTFFATNLAWYLHRRGGRRVCLVDLDLQFGEVASALRLRPRSTIVDLLQAGAADGDLVERFEDHCEVHESGISVLAAPRDPTDARAVQPADVSRVLDAARRCFDDVVVDTPAGLSDTVVTVCNRSDELVVLATLDVPSVRNMHVFLSTLERLDVDRGDIRLLLNKAETDAGIETGQIQKLFPQGFQATLPYAREVPRSINAGLPVLATSPDAPISRQLETVLARLLLPEARANVEERLAQERPARAWRRSRRVRETVS